MTRRTGTARGLRRAAGLAVGKVWGRVPGGGVDGHKFRREHPIGPYFADFACERLRLVVEIDGGVHRRDEAVAGDHLRQGRIEAMGWTVVRLDNETVLATPWAVDEAIRRHAREMGIPSPGGRGLERPRA